MKMILLFVTIMLFSCMNEKAKLTLPSNFISIKKYFLGNIAPIASVDTTGNFILLHLTDSYSIREDLFYINLDSHWVEYFSRRSRLDFRMVPKENWGLGTFSIKEKALLTKDEVFALKESLFVFGENTGYFDQHLMTISADFYLKYDGNEYFHTMPWNLGMDTTFTREDYQASTNLEKCLREVFSKIPSANPVKSTVFRKYAEDSLYRLDLGLCLKEGETFNYVVKEVLEVENIPPYERDDDFFVFYNNIVSYNGVFASDTTALRESVKITFLTYSGDTIVY